MNKKLDPFLFEPIYKDAIWGGERIAGMFHRTAVPLRCAESWEISDRPEKMSRVAEGPFKGKTLHELVEQFGEDLLGRGRKDSRFPLLIKIIDAREALSVQVHPSIDTAAPGLGEPKTEMWYVVEGGPVYAGFKEPIDENRFRRAIKDHCVIDLIQKHQTKPGDAVYIPGGRVHAIGAGCVIIEVQQNSDTTFRIYDWNRLGAGGKPRSLHIEQAMQCIKFDDDNDPSVSAEILEDSETLKRWRVLSTLFFSIERLEFTDRYRVNPDSKTFQIFFHLKGPNLGMCSLIAASSHPIDWTGPATMLRITIENG